MKILILLFLPFSLLARDLDFCRNNSLHKGHSIPFNKNKDFVSRCAPRFLYSWQDSKRVGQWIKEKNKDNILPLKKNKNGDSALFLWIDPIGTFAYGDTAVRFTLKSDVEFEYIGPERFICQRRIAYFNRKTVYVRYFKTSFGQEGSEYIICDHTPIESWSIHTSTHYKETLIELQKVLTDRKYKTWEPYIKNYTYFNALKGSVDALPRIKTSVPATIKKAGLGELYKIASDFLILGYNVDVSDRFWKKDILLERLLKFYQNTSKPQIFIDR